MALAGLILTVGLWIGGRDATSKTLLDMQKTDGAVPLYVSEEAQVDVEANRWTRATAVPGRSVEAVEGAVQEYSYGQPRIWGIADDVAQAIICAEGTPWPCEWALALAFCESSFNVEAWATEIVRGVRYYFHGWFQIVSTSPDPGPLADPVYNTERAAEKYRSEKGVGHWPACP